MWPDPKQHRINDMAARLPHIHRVGGRWECRTGAGLSMIVGIGASVRDAFKNAVEYRARMEKL